MGKWGSVPEDAREGLLVVLRAMFAEGAEKLYIAQGAGRVFVGREPATKFADREGTPENLEVVPSDLDALAAK